MNWKDADIYGELLEMIQYDLKHEDHKIVHAYVKNLVRANKRKAIEKITCTLCREGYRRAEVAGDGYWHEWFGTPMRCANQTRPVSEQLQKLAGKRA